MNAFKHIPFERAFAFIRRVNALPVGPRRKAARLLHVLADGAQFYAQQTDEAHGRWLRTIALQISVSI